MNPRLFSITANRPLAGCGRTIFSHPVRQIIEPKIREEALTAPQNRILELLPITFRRQMCFEFLSHKLEVRS